MDFFEAQDIARRRTAYLIWLFVLTVIIIGIAVYGAIIVALYCGSAFEYKLWISRLDTYLSWSGFLYTELCVVLLIGTVGVIKYFEFIPGGGAIARSLGGRWVDPTTRIQGEKRLFNVVEEMALASGVPIPEVYIIDHEYGINAFASGLTLNDAAVTVTAGCLVNLGRDELQGVIAHEFSHIVNGDMRLNTKLAAAMHGIFALSIVGRLLQNLFSRLATRVRMAESGTDLREVDPWGDDIATIREKMKRRDDDYQGTGLGRAGGGIGGDFRILVTLIVIVVAIILITIIGYIGHFFARIIQAAVSIQREYLADALAIRFTRNPGALSNAFKRVGGSVYKSKVDIPSAISAAHFFFAEPVHTLLSINCHPKLEKRISAIEPGWNGKMLKPETIQQPVYTPSSLSTIDPLQALSLTEQVGQLRSPNLHYAAILIESIPREVRDALLDSTYAEALVYILLVDKRRKYQESQWNRISAKAESSVLQAIIALAPRLQNMENSCRLPLLELALPSIRGKSVEQLERFEELIDELIVADGEISLFEYILRRIVHDRLINHSLNRVVDPSFRKRPKTNEIRYAASVVLTAMASVSSRDLDTVNSNVMNSSSEAGYQPRLSAVPPEERQLEHFDEALSLLRRTHFIEHKRILNALELFMKRDKRLTLDETDLYRAIAIALDCPVPIQQTDVERYKTL